MKKNGKIITGIIILIAILYSVFWFYSANQIKKSTKTLIENFNRSQKSMVLKTSKISIGGFPTYYKIQLSDLSISTLQLNQITTFNGNIEIKHNLFDKKIIVSAPKKITKTVDDMPTLILYKGRPSISFSLNKSLKSIAASNVIPSQKIKLLKCINSINVILPKNVVTIKSSNKLISKSSGVSFKYSLKKNKDNKYLININTTPSTTTIFSGIVDVFNKSLESINKLSKTNPSLSEINNSVKVSNLAIKSLKDYFKLKNSISIKGSLDISLLADQKVFDEFNFDKFYNAKINTMISIDKSGIDLRSTFNKENKKISLDLTLLNYVQLIQAVNEMRIKLNPNYNKNSSNKNFKATRNFIESLGKKVKNTNNMNFILKVNNKKITLNGLSKLELMMKYVDFSQKLKKIKK